MNFLLDTQLLVWGLKDPQRLPKTARELMEDRGNDLWFSSVSIWEIAIKRGLGRPGFDIDPRIIHRGLLDSGYRELTLTSEQAVFVDTLPPIHNDPFDRVLLAQAISEGITLLTADAELAKYRGPIRKV